jgi:hypothetical protein
MRSRRLLNKAMRGKIGVPVSEDNLEKAWGELKFGERNRLRFSQFFNTMAKPITKDLTNIYLNLAFISITLIPGPSGFFVIPALAASYALRWDERAVKARKGVFDLIKNDVNLDNYKDVIKLYPDYKYKLDKDALMQRKLDSLAHSTEEVKLAASKHIPETYHKIFIHPAKKTGAFFERQLTKITSEDKAKKMLSPLFNFCSRAEKKAIKGILSFGKKADKGIKATGGFIKETFNATIELGHQAREQLYYGYEFNKREIKKALNL